VIAEGFDKTTILQWVNALESNSSHPVAAAINRYIGSVNPAGMLEEVEEVAGLGLRAKADGKPLLVGNFRLLDAAGISYPIDPDTIVHTVAAIAYDGKF